MMKNLTFKQLSRSFAILALASLGSAAMAGSTWTLSLGTQCGDANAVSSANCSSNGVAATATAYTSSGNSGGSKFSTSVLKYWGAGSGYGVQNASDPEHSLDNSGATDFIALDFGNLKVNLSQITLGWSDKDSDITVLAYTGAGDPTLSNKTINSFTASNGWSSVTNYGTSAATAFGNTDTVVKTTDKATYSSWWLISAYNSNFGAGSLDSYKDYVKLLAVAGSTESPTTGVPEPGSLALMGIAMAGFVATRRRKQQAV